TPAKRNTTGLPVLVYFYGGGFIAGDGSEPRYDGASMAEKGIVVVTVNYRLNIFGFFSHPELSAESPYKASGNYGLLDQNAALKWVQKNISAFGGDPKQVTIAGESAGAASVHAQVVSPLSKGLFARAICESGSFFSMNRPNYNLPDAEKLGLEFAQKAGYPSLKELRKLSTRDLYEMYQESQRFGFPAVIDGYFFPKTPLEIYINNEQAQVQLLIGWNSAEGSGLGFMNGKPYDEENYLIQVKETYPDNYEQILELYPWPQPDRDVELSATALASDRFIAFGTWKWFDLHRRNTQQPVYRYLFSRIRPPKPGATTKDIGAPHASEIEYCMGNLHLIKDIEWTEEDYIVSKAMHEYFANFIKTGNPNGPDLPEWSPVKVTDEAPKIMQIDVESKMVKANNEFVIIFWIKFFQTKYLGCKNTHTY
ncbi:MAG: carboxylesterase family protein, partial [Bacteroidales bacterium]|nr:carboxylesterase family protein [Bacteroidales bacterium]